MPAVIPVVDHKTGLTAIDADILAGNKASFLGGQKQHHIGNVQGIAHTTCRLLEGNYQANFGMINQPPFQSIQQMFPQPQGSVYSISSPIEIGNVPIGSTGLSVALCLPE